MKMQKESCSRLGSKSQENLVYMTKYFIVLVIMDMAKSDVIGPIEKSFFFATLN